MWPSSAGATSARHVSAAAAAPSQTRDLAAWNTAGREARLDALEARPSRSACDLQPSSPLIPRFLSAA
jgi:hypothetical protein